MNRRYILYCALATPLLAAFPMSPTQPNHEMSEFMRQVSFEIGQEHGIPVNVLEKISVLGDVLRWEGIDRYYAESV